MKRKHILSLVLVFVLAILGACGNKDDNNNSKGNEPNEGGEIELPEADLDGIPDIVAEINGSEIIKKDFEAAYMSEFQQASLNAMMSGEEIDQDEFRNYIVEQMITQELLIQVANEKDFEVTEEEKEEFLTSLASSNGFDDTDEFIKELEEQDITEDELNEVVENNIKIEHFIDNEVKVEDPTNDEMKELYDQLVAQGEESEEEVEIPTFEEYEDQLFTHLKQQKQNVELEKIINKERESADIKIHL